MLIPQFSVRWLLGVMTASAGVFAIFGLALRGHLWAAGISAAVIALVVVMLVYAVLFGAVWTFSSIVSLFSRSPGSRRPPLRENLTASEMPPSEKNVPANPTVLE